MSQQQQKDLRRLLRAAIPVLHAMVDVVASSGWARPAMLCMDLCQMVVQGLWVQKDSPLLQVPHFEAEHVERARAVGAEAGAGGEGKEEGDEEEEAVETVYDLLEMEDGPRMKLLSMTPAQVGSVAAFCNRYPSLEVQWGVVGADGVLRRGATEDDDDEDEDEDEDEEKGPAHKEFSVTEGQTAQLVVRLEREGGTEGLDEGAGIGAVLSRTFPGAKSEHWWVVVTEPSANRILAIKRVTIGKHAKARL